MQEFSILLLNATKTMGTLLEVANLLSVEPKMVYGWLAGFEQPPADAVPNLTEQPRAGAWACAESGANSCSETRSTARRNTSVGGCSSPRSHSARWLGVTLMR